MMNGKGYVKKLACTIATAGTDKTMKVSGNAEFWPGFEPENTCLWRINGSHYIKTFILFSSN
jgi:hypothetical protein